MTEEEKCPRCGTEYPLGSEYGECDWCPGIAIRRSKAAMKALVEQMRDMEAQGKSRKEIALTLNCTPAQVTRGLGPVRQWRGRRIAA